jgi:hypothetical protein
MNERIMKTLAEDALTCVKWATLCNEGPLKFPGMLKVQKGLGVWVGSITQVQNDILAFCLELDHEQYLRL